MCIWNLKDPYGSLLMKATTNGYWDGGIAKCFLNSQKVKSDKTASSFLPTEGMVGVLSSYQQAQEAAPHQKEVKRAIAAHSSREMMY